MTKQEEIREGTQVWVDNRLGVPNTFNMQFLWDYLKWLDSQDVAIKVDREDALILVNVEDRDWHNENFLPIRISHLVEAGFVAVEPLIKE